MKKYQLILPVLAVLAFAGASLFVAPLAANAIAVNWDRPAAGRINPIYPLDTVYGNSFTATSTTAASLFQHASSTLFSAYTAYFGATATSSFSSAGALTLATPLLASSGGTGISSLGSGIATWLGTPSSANLGTALTDETGTGLAVFNASPSFTGKVALVNASSTLFSNVGTAYFGGTATTTISSNGSLALPSGASFTFGNTTGLLVGASGTVSAYAGVSCSSQALTALSASGASTCASISDAFLTGQVGLAHGGTNASLSGASQIIAMNAGNTALTGVSGYTLTSSLLTAPNATTTNLTASQELVIPNGATKGSNVAGQIELDTTNDQLKTGDGTAQSILDPRRFLSFTYGTTTAFTGTTTQLLGTAPTGLTFKSAQCYTDVGTVNIAFKYGSGPTLLPTLVGASTTPGVWAYASNNTPAALDKLFVDIGTPASSPTTISCTAVATITGT